jgi:hypothetical protein
VSENVYLVFSKPPQEIGAAEYGEWYEGHVRDILGVEGFAAARRFDLEPARGDTSPTMYSHLALYAIDGDAHEAMARLAEVTGSAQVPLPGWFDGIRFASFHTSPLETDPIDLDRLDHVYAVFSTPPAGMDHEFYFDWYHTHARENLTADGFERVWRYRLEPDSVDPQAPATCVHAALYEIHGEMPELRAALKEAADAGRVGFPDFFDDILFASLECRAASRTLARA